MPGRFSLILCGILVVIAGIFGVISYRTSHTGLPYPFPVTDIIFGLIVIGMALGMRRH